MNTNELEDLYLRSLETALSPAEQEILLRELQKNAGLAQELATYRDIRATLLRKRPATFGPYFAQKVVNRIHGMRIEIDRQIVFFFRKYQLAAVGVLIALLAINVLFADQLNLPSIFGLTDTVSAEEELAGFNFIDTLTSN
ncbi:MAG: hypothetical protein U0289_06405 [Cyclobacteriaceae bacterium]|jgi:hypothetical protein|nr:hypothetical protein [Cyclobacteriaceae bacterium]